ncbi:hypothetical protein LEP1GSC008_2945 [Leptospira kirschneri serovar Bulgarica str. Nikolaevo]|uniref:Uncharacterized protein n=1 Tax=Leptospira kirschneri serovar Bulgarica str. Nikolaevo TaxID=1240687 RepID=M6F254_9LEPT|nr:hypothetical protein LEP1GSC008_2945 [Leptospira kirschneri serovar Bulgarica str. Nikolaevo]
MEDLDVFGSFLIVSEFLHFTVWLLFLDKILHFLSFRIFKTVQSFERNRKNV